MTGVLTRAGWLLSAVFFATILSSIVHVDYVGVIADLLLLLVVVLAALRPDVGIVLAAAAAPVAWYLASQLWNSGIAWAEAIACAVITGASLNASFRQDRSFRLKADATGHEGRIPLSLSAPAVLFGAVVIASVIAGLWAQSFRFGPGFTHGLVIQLTREYFVDVQGFPALHAGVLLLEGVLLFTAAGRMAAESPGDSGFLHRVAAATVVSATLAALLNFDRLVRSAWRGESFWASLIDLAGRIRLNVHYPDFNAAGSYFVMALLVAAALAVRARGSRWIGWTLSAITIALALWLTSSRMAVLAGLVAPGAVVLATEMTRGRARARRAGAIAAGGLVLLAVIAVALPQRGSQKSGFLALDVRLGLLHTGARMIATRPVFGIGLGEFYQRSAEFSSPELIAKFPAVATHENAHNNFMQVTAELGLAGGLFFTWLVVAALVTIARRATTTPDVLMLAAPVAFVLTCLGGHPLLLPEPGYAFWVLLGTAAGAAMVPGAARVRRWRWLRWIAPIGLIAIALTLPWRIRAAREDTNLDHVGIGVSTWQVSPDGIRYREARGHATVFVPTGASLISVYPLTDEAVRLELKRDGRIADVVTLAPRRWNDLRLAARTEATNARFAALDLRVLDADQTAIWITKVQPIR
jgi:O-antigen ligase